ncbi:MAG: SDR family oxidoreductase [Planctomycetes bacterium]|nr:SDR family oxidoreductase [Planctomycetota bacterium]
MQQHQGPLILLTGATAGIGQEAARQLAAQGATVVCVARNEAKARALVEELKRSSGNDRHAYLVGDLSQVADVKRVAREYRERFDRLDVLFNNAGALFVDRQLTAEGLERTFAVNHLAYFVLTTELLDLLQASGSGRVVSTSSAAHHQGDLGFLEDLQNERWGVGGMRPYGRSKLANIWFTVELARRLEGTGVTANCFHPGFVASDFASNNGFAAKVFMALTRPFQRGVSKGADTGVWLATAPELAGKTGGYYHNRKLRKTSKAARDPQAPARLWERSEQIVAELV